MKTLKPRMDLAQDRIKTHTTAAIRNKGRSWMETRQRILQRDFGICQACKKIGRLTRERPLCVECGSS